MFRHLGREAFLRMALRCRKHVGENTSHKLHFIKCINLVDVSTDHNICQGLRYSISVTSYREHSPYPDADGPVKTLLHHYVKVRHSAARSGMYNVYNSIPRVVLHLPSGQYSNMWL
jgi:hypothetical protein